MGVIRKTMSATTLGLIDFRSDKERIARSTRHTAHAAKKQNKLLAEQNQLLAQQQTAQQQATQQPVPQQPMPTAPGWFPDNYQPGMLRWWDGRQWTDQVQQAAARY